MTDAQRELWWAEPTLINGKVVEVKAMKELPDGSLREPRFKCIREDKTIGDID
jgi:DNA ligase-1